MMITASGRSLGEYIGRIYQEVRDRPRYMVKKVHQTKQAG